MTDIIKIRNSFVDIELHGSSLFLQKPGVSSDEYPTVELFDGVNKILKNLKADFSSVKIN